MTVKELRELCQQLEKEGKGENPVIWQSLSHTWDIALTETTRGGKPVILVNA